MLLKHHDLGHAALAIVEQGEHPKHSVPKSISELFKVVSKTKRSLIQVLIILTIHCMTVKENDSEDFDDIFKSNNCEHALIDN